MARNIKSEKFLSSYEKANILNLLREYLDYGGYPEVIFFKEQRNNKP